MRSEKEQAKDAMADMDRANRASELLSNPLYIEAITVMRAAMFAEFEDSKYGSADDRHELWQRAQVIKQFQARFEEIVKKGERGRQTLTLLEKARSLI
jgi:hypothetical protein